MLGKLRRALVWGALLVLVTGTWFGLDRQSSGTKSEFSKKVPLEQQSKAMIVADIRQAVANVEQMEETLGQKNPSGYVVYGAEETARLFQVYQALQARLSYLREGVADESLQWAGNPLANSGKVLSYRPQQVRRALDGLEGKIPAVFLKDYRIFLTPFALSGISGMGGAGFSLIFSLPESFGASDADLTVTLYHELGHNVHLSYMPEDTGWGRELWKEYHDFRGGSWQDAGAAGTGAWSASSEETFAEDFRMVFGEAQPFFEDMALGDPRAQSGVVEAFKAFVERLPEQMTPQAYHSPWIPVNISFWMVQEYLIGLLWGALLTVSLYYRSYTSRRFFPKTTSAAVSF